MSKMFKRRPYSVFQRCRERFDFKPSEASKVELVGFELINKRIISVPVAGSRAVLRPKE